MNNEITSMRAKLCGHTFGIALAEFDQDGNRIDDTILPFITRDEAAPASNAKKLYTAKDNQPFILIKVYQGESLHPEHDLLLEEITVALPPLPIGAPIDVRFSYDINGLLEVEITIDQTKERISKLIRCTAEKLSISEIAQSVMKFRHYKVFCKTDSAARAWRTDVDTRMISHSSDEIENIRMVKWRQTLHDYINFS